MSIETNIFFTFEANKTEVFPHSRFYLSALSPYNPLPLLTLFLHTAFYTLNGYTYYQRWAQATSKVAPPHSRYQRWSPRGHILKSLALASRPQVLENWPVLGSRTALFFELLKFCGALEKFFRKRFFVEIA